MTRNKKKLRSLERLAAPVKKCRTGLAGTVFAGVMLGGLLLALPGTAGATAFNPTGPQTYTEQITVTTPWTDFSGSQLFTAGLLVSGSTDGKFHGILGDAASSVTLRGTSTLNAGAAVSAGKVTLDGGTTTLSGVMASPGPGNAAWRAGTMLEAQTDLTVTGNSTHLALGNWGQAVTWGDAKVNILNGATLAMTSTSADEASLLRVSKGQGTGVLTIGSAGQVSLGSGAYGFIIAPHLLVDGADSRITVDKTGSLTIQNWLSDAQNAAGTTLNEAYSGGTWNKGVTMLSGDVRLSKGGRINTDTGLFKAGTISIDGYAGGERSGIYDTADISDAGDYTFGVGSTGPSVSLSNGGGIEGKAIVLNGGSYTVGGAASGLASSQAAWRKGSLIQGDNNLTISGASQVLVNAGGILGVGAEDNTESNTGLSVEGGSVTLNGDAASAATMVAFTQAMAPSASGDAKMTIKKTGSVNVTGYGRMVAANLAVTDGGRLSVAQGGHLLVGQGYVSPTDQGLAGNFDSAYALQVYNTTLSVGKAADSTILINGDALISADKDDPAKQGIVDIHQDGLFQVTGNLTSTGGRLFMNDSNTFSTGGTAIIGGTYSDKSITSLSPQTFGKIGRVWLGALELKDSNSTLTFDGQGGVFLGFSGLGEGKSFFNGKTINVGTGTRGTLNLEGAGGSFNREGQVVVLNTSASGGTIALNQGNWKLGHVLLSGGSTGGGMGADYGHLTIGLLNGETAADKLGGRADSPDLDLLTFDIGSTGAITLNLDDFVQKGADGTWSSSILADGSKAEINGVLELLNGASLTVSDISAIKSTAGIFGTGLLSFTGAQITDLEQNADTDLALKGTVALGGGAGATDLGVLLKDQVVGAEGSAGTADITVAGSFGADSLVVKDTSASGVAAASTVAVDNETSLTLIGGKGQLVSVKDANGNGTNAETKIQLGTDSALKLGDLTAARGSGKLDELELSGTDGSLQVLNGDYTLGKLTATATGGTANIVGNGSLTLERADLSNAISINVGNAGGKGTVIAKKDVDFNGSVIFLDPAWKDGNLITDASQMVHEGQSMNAKITAGQNSWFLLGGADRSWVSAAFKDSGLTWGPNNITAAAAIYKPVTLGTLGGLRVDGSLTSNTVALANNANFAAKSLLIVNADSLGNVALTATGNTGGVVTVAADSKLLLANAVTGTQTILSGFTDASSSGLGAGDTGWAGSNLYTTSYLLEAVRGNIDATTGRLTVSVSQKKVTDVLPGISSGMAALVDSMYRQKLNDYDSANAGVKFVSRATDSLFAPREEAAKILEGAAQIAQAGGAAGTALLAANVVSDAMAQRTNLAAPMTGTSGPAERGVNGGEGMGYGLGVWAMPLYQHEKVSGMKAENFNSAYKSDLYGGIIGLDATNDLAGGKLRLGIALNVGSADVRSNGDFASTKNDVDFWGASLYAGWRYDMFALSADFGYTSTSNDLRQDLPSSLGMGSQLKSDVDAEVYTLGLKGEYTFKTDFVDITPNVALRYRHYKQDAFSVNSHFGDVFNIDKAEMDTWTFPIGVSFSRDFEVNGWMLTPQLDLRYIPAAGDLDIKHTAKIPALPITAADLSSDVVDRNTGEVGLGLSLRKDNLAFGLNYDYQGSKNRDAHGVFASFRYDF